MNASEPIADGRPGPLAGYRIIEVGHMLAGPYCGMLLADLGAEVVKIETPDGGDIGRRMGPHAVGPHNTYFASLNRGKKSVVLDLASADGRAKLERLVRRSHGLVTNLRPSAIIKLGLTYEGLKGINPTIVCAALTGYGLDGPFATRPAYDYVIQALAGTMTLTGDPGTPPVKVGYSVVDNTTGMLGALGIVSMILEGRGGQLDVSLYDTMLSQMNYIASAWMNAGEKPARQRSGAHPYMVPAQTFETADGYLTLFISHDGFWRAFADELDRPDWLADERFATMAARTANREIVIADVAAALKRETTEAWMARLAPLGLVVAGVATLEDALASELTAARNMVTTIETDHGPLRLVASPIHVAGRDGPYAPPPLFGEHTAIADEEPAAGVVADGRARIRALALQRLDEALASADSAGSDPEAAVRALFGRLAS